MQEQIVIRVENATVRFNMATEKIETLKEYVIKMFKRQLMFQEFLALKNITFHVHKGESVGIIGRNGSGKSTLLKVIAGIIRPYRGNVFVSGKIAPLIELGVGFDGDLTARENIFLGGTLMGQSRKFLEKSFDEIVSFAEIEDFLDMPIKNYSSGMSARLGFSLATAVRHDILIIDEVLAVGDMQFQIKCEARMAQLMQGGMTVLYVSHDTEQVKRLCRRVIWLDKGRVVMDGDAQTVCGIYEEAQTHG